MSDPTTEFAATHLLTPDPEVDREALLDRLRAAAPGALLARPLPGSIRGGELLVHHTTADRAAADHWAETVAAVPGSVTGVRYRPGTAGRRDGAGTVYRTLLLAIDPGTPDAVRERFERDTLAMAAHVTSMRWWRLSRVDEAIGGTALTHVWEQVFADAASVTGQYMLHPVHWGLVDRWFDPEVPERIVSAPLHHVFCDLPAR